MQVNALGASRDLDSTKSIQHNPSLPAYLFTYPFCGNELRSDIKLLIRRLMSQNTQWKLEPSGIKTSLFQPSRPDTRPTTANLEAHTPHAGSKLIFLTRFPLTESVSEGFEVLDKAPKSP